MLSTYRYVLLSAFFVCVTFFFAHSAFALTPLSSCSDISISDTYILSNTLAADGGCLNITASSVVIDGDGFFIENGTFAIHSSASSITLINLSLRNVTFGILLNNSDSFQISNSTISNISTAIKVDNDSDSGTIFNISIINATRGLSFLNDSNANTLENITISTATTGIESNATNNFFTNITASSGTYGLYAHTGAQPHVENSSFNSFTRGIWLSSTQNVVIRNTTFASNLNGIYVTGITNSTTVNMSTISSSTGDALTINTSGTTFILDAISISGTSVLSSDLVVDSVRSLTIFNNTIGSYSWHNANGTIKRTNIGTIIIANNTDVTGTSLQSDAYIASNNITIGSFSGNHEFTLYGLSTSYENPQLHRNGTICGTTCINYTSLNVATINYLVTQTGTYSVAESPSISACFNSTISDTYFIVNNSFSTAYACLSFTGERTNISGNGQTITYGSDSTNFIHGLRINTSNVRIENLTINASQSTNTSNLFIIGSTNISVINTTLNSGRYALLLTNTTNFSYYLGTLGNVTINDSMNGTIESITAGIFTATNVENVTIRNVSRASAVISNSFVIEEEFLTVTTNDILGNPISGVTINVSNGSQLWNGTTNSEGKFITALPENYYTSGGTSGAPTYSINASKSQHTQISTTFDFTSNQTFTLTFSETAACGTFSTSNYQYNFSANVDASGSCIVISGDNITINGNGNRIIGNGSGTLVRSTGSGNSIENFFLDAAEFGVNSSGSITLQNMTLRNISQALTSNTTLTIRNSSFENVTNVSIGNANITIANITINSSILHTVFNTTQIVSATNISLYLDSANFIQNANVSITDYSLFAVNDKLGFGNSNTSFYFTTNTNASNFTIQNVINVSNKYFSVNEYYLNGSVNITMKSLRLGLYPIIVANGTQQCNTTATPSCYAQNTLTYANNASIGAMASYYNLTIKSYDIILIHPTNDTTTENSSITLEFNVTTTFNQTLNHCNITFDDVWHKMYTTFENPLQLNLTSVSDDVHEWEVTCIDTTNLTLSQTGTFNVTEATFSSGGGGGGGGGGAVGGGTFWINTYEEDTSNINSNVSHFLKARDGIRIKFKEKSYHIGLITLSQSRVTVNISRSSTNLTAEEIANNLSYNSTQIIININESDTADLNDDDIYDIRISYSDYKNGRGNITITPLVLAQTASEQEEVNTTLNETAQLVESNTTENEQQTTAPIRQKVSSSSNSLPIWPIFVALIIAGLTGFAVNVIRKMPKKISQKNMAQSGTNSTQQLQNQILVAPEPKMLLDPATFSFIEQQLTQGHTHDAVTFMLIERGFEHMQAKELMHQFRLDLYVRDCLAKKIPASHIRAALAQSGWSEEILSKVFD